MIRQLSVVGSRFGEPIGVAASAELHCCRRLSRDLSLRRLGVDANVKNAGVFGAE